MFACTAVIVLGEVGIEASDSSTALYLTREEGERKYCCGKKELYLATQGFLEKALCQLIHMHSCDNYFPLP